MPQPAAWFRNQGKHMVLLDMLSHSAAVLSALARRPVSTGKELMSAVETFILELFTRTKDSILEAKLFRGVIGRSYCHVALFVNLLRCAPDLEDDVKLEIAKKLEWLLNVLIDEDVYVGDFSVINGHLVVIMAGNTVKDMTTNFGKLDKFEGHDFRRWQKKMHFLLTTLKVVYVLTTPMPELLEDATVEAIRIRAKWENDDYICRGHILNGMSDSLFDVYTNVESAKELWDSLESKYMAEDSS
ncbi:hypothetical protein Tco_1381897, partial [Tanacetum coccineum]